MFLSPVAERKSIPLHRGERRTWKLDLRHARCELVDQRRVELAAARETFQVVVQLEKCGERNDPLGLQNTGHVLYDLRVGVRIRRVARASQQFDQAFLRRGKIGRSGGLQEQPDAVLSSIKDISVAMQLREWSQHASQSGIRL